MTMKKNTTLPQQTFTEWILRSLYKAFPFDLKGDISVLPANAIKGHISCIIPTRRGSSILRNLLTDLTRQTLSTDQFNVIIYDNTPEGIAPLIKEFSSLLRLHHLPDTAPTGMIGQFRNTALMHASGEYILFLDDDTRIRQRDLLSNALELFNTHQADIILAKGEGLALKEHPNYCFLDAYSFAARCSFYKRSLLEKLGGFRGDITGYEDIELGIRASMMNASILRTAHICYQHPPLFFHSLQKPIAIGQSILRLRGHYPFLIWLAIYGNALRFLGSFVFRAKIVGLKVRNADGFSAGSNGHLDTRTPFALGV